MTKRKGERISRWPWTVPLVIADVPEAGRHLDLAADTAARSAIADLAGLRALPRLVAAFDVTLHGRGGLHVTGRVSATVGQICVVTLEPIDNEIEEEVDLAFMPDAALLAKEGGIDDDAPETLVDGTVDLGAIATEFLLLALDPYPRKSGAVFEASPREDDGAHPFAALAALKKGRDAQGG